jgi:beta-phosphoglucomutase-like phosphatase (HAD superfamily)
MLFDLDGVITSEKAYWDSARLTLLQPMQLERVGSTALPTGRKISQVGSTPRLILRFKARAMNAKWYHTLPALCTATATLLWSVRVGTPRC